MRFTKRAGGGPLLLISEVLQSSTLENLSCTTSLETEIKPTSGRKREMGWCQGTTLRLVLAPG